MNQVNDIARLTEYEIAHKTHNICHSSLRHKYREILQKHINLLVLFDGFQLTSVSHLYLSLDALQKRLVLEGLMCFFCSLTLGIL